MNVNYFERKYNRKEISIEKLFSVIKDEMEKSGIIINSIQNPYTFSLINIIKGMLFFRKNQGEINHITGDIHWACILLDKNKTLLTVHDIGRLNEISGFRKLIYYFFWLYLPFKRMKYITAISEKTKRDIVDIFPWASGKISVIPNCITISIEESKVNTASKLSKLLIVGTRSNKNIERAIQALNGLSIELSIVGQLSQVQSNLLYENSVNFKNYKYITDAELKLLYLSSDILLFPSTFEGFGLPILEAQASNCIVVTSAIEPMKEVAGEAAIFVEPYDIISIKDGLQMAINLSHEQRTHFINLGKKNVEKYSIEEITDLYLNLYKKIRE